MTVMIWGDIFFTGKENENKEIEL